MTKATESEQARRVNVTVSWLKKKTSRSKAVGRLMAQYGISRRQAYRYLQQAQATPSPRPIPEEKGVFTVKLSLLLIRQVRQQARRQRCTISHWVDQALRHALTPRKGHG